MYLGGIQDTLAQGLLQEKDKKQYSYMEMIQATVEKGLLTKSGADNKVMPLIANAGAQAAEAAVESGKNLSETINDNTDKLRKDIQFTLSTLAGIDAEILLENKLQSALQSRSIAPNLGRIRKNICKDDERPEDILPPTITSIFVLPDNCDIQSLAVANHAGKVCVGGLQRDTNQYFIKQKIISWTSNSYNISNSFGYSANAERPYNGADMEEIGAYTKIYDLAYSNDSSELFLLYMDSTVHSFAPPKMGKYELKGRIAFPFFQIPGNLSKPYIALWKRNPNRIYYLSLISSDGAKELKCNPDFADFIKRLTETESPPDNSGKILIKSNLRKMIIAGSKELAVAGFDNISDIRLVKNIIMDDQISDLDISSNEDLAIMCNSNGELLLWYYKTDTIPKPLKLQNSNHEIIRVFLGPNGHELALITKKSLDVYTLNGFNSLEFGGSYEIEIKQASQSPDRRHIMVATNDNSVSLFSFGLKI